MHQPPKIEIINRNFQGHSFKCAVFDFDGTISLLREQWPGVMSQLMVEMIAGETEPASEIRQEVAKYVERSAGVSTISQMRKLVELVKKYGQVPTEQISTAEGYKDIYDQRLLNAVNEKLEMLAAGRLALTDLIVPGAVEFLDILAQRGLVLYVASTTDLKYLLPEAEALNVTHYFRKIYAPDPTLPEYSKDWLVSKVIEWHDLRPDQLLVVGDGQVEISVAKKHGGVALGVASAAKGDGTVNQMKREMLIKAGADLVVPDFSGSQRLVTFLFNETALSVD